MKTYKVSYYETDCEGRIPCGAAPVEEYFMDKEKAEARAENRKGLGWCIKEVKIEEIEIN